MNIRAHSAVVGSLSSLLGVLLFAPAARAQEDGDPAPGLMKQDAATAGTTNVAEETFAAAAKDAEDAKDTLELKLSAGGLAATGNSRSLALTASGDFRIRRGDNQLSAMAAANYGRAAADRDSDMETTVQNEQGRVRYDRFLTEHLAAFFAVSARHDPFQGLDLRLNFDPGFAYYVIDEKTHQLWGELGYDLQYDVRSDDALDVAAAAGDPQEKTETRHSGRAFVGYDNKLNEAVTFKTGLEYLQGLDKTENWRLNWDAALTSQIAGNFSLSTTFTLKYDHNPLPTVADLDTVTAISLVYQLL
ncbi:MAG TPA: DUF481 domain-containing protein [Polyangiaceae bacterium]